MRVVSLLASATEIVCALGAGEMLVGRSHECDEPAWVRRLPKCSEPAFDVETSSGEIDAEVRRRIRAGEPLYLLDGERIRGLKPDLLLTQTHCEVCAVTPEDVERAGVCAVDADQLAVTAFALEDVFAGMSAIAERLGLAERGAALVAAERARLAAVRAATDGRGRPRVAMLEWTDPVFCMGNWGPELVEVAQGELVLGAKGEYSRVVSGEELREADPEFVVVAPCGFGLERAWGERATLARQPWWAELRAVREGKVAFADGNLYFNRSGMTVTRTAEILAEILHGVVTGERSEGVAWRWAR